MIEKLKTLVIIFLIFFTVYQLFDYWYDFSIEDIVQSLKSKETKKNEDSNYCLKPKQIATSLGNKQFLIISYNEKEKENTIIDQYILEIYDEIFKQNTEIQESSKQLIDVYNERSIILEYDYNYSKDEFEKIFQIQNEKLLKKIDNIKTLIIVPKTKENEKADIYLINKEVEIFQIKLGINTTELYGYIDEVNLFNQNNICSLSINDATKKYMDSAILLPRIINKIDLLENKYIAHNGFSVNGVYDDEKCEECINIFYDNPKGKWKMDKDANTVIFGDGEKTVRADKSGFLEYMTNSVEDEKFDMNDAIETANRFIKKDTVMKNELYLKKVEILSDISYKVCYGMKIDGMEYIANDKLMKKFKSDYPVEVIVFNNKVINYKKIVQDMTSEKVNKERELIGCDEIIESVVNNYGKIKIRDMQLAYYLAGFESEIKLSWIITLENGKQIVHDALREVR